MIQTLCYACNKPIEIYDKISREERCPHCGADLHCCYNCYFFDEKAYNECHEPIAERVVDKDRSNFCSYFRVSEGPQTLKASKLEADEAKRKLEALFPKKS